MIAHVFQTNIESCPITGATHDAVLLHMIDTWTRDRFILNIFSNAWW